MDKMFWTINNIRQLPLKLYNKISHTFNRGMDSKTFVFVLDLLTKTTNLKTELWKHISVCISTFHILFILKKWYLLQHFFKFKMLHIKINALLFVCTIITHYISYFCFSNIQNNVAGSIDTWYMNTKINNCTVLLSLQHLIKMVPQQFNSALMINYHRNILKRMSEFDCFAMSQFL